MRRITYALATAAIIGALALHTPKARAQDRWGDAHAKVHLVGEAGIASLATLAANNDPVVGFWTATAVGLAREEWKRQHGFSNFTVNRLVLNTAGAALGAYTTHWIIGPGRVVYHLEF